MMKREYILARNISLILIGFFLSSCSSQVELEVEKIDIKYWVNNYNTDYAQYYENESFEALLFYIKASDKYIDKIVIQDYSIDRLYKEIREKADSSLTVWIGVVDKAPIKILYDNNSEIPIPLIVLKDSLLIQKAYDLPRFFDEDGNELDIFIDEGIGEYDPRMIISYIPSLSKKTMVLSNGAMIETTFLFEIEQANINK